MPATAELSPRNGKGTSLPFFPTASRMRDDPSDGLRIQVEKQVIEERLVSSGIVVLYGDNDQPVGLVIFDSHAFCKRHDLIKDGKAEICNILATARNTWPKIASVVDLMIPKFQGIPEPYIFLTP